MNISVVNNVLDTAAFLLVTIDLYGRERIEGLSKRLRSFRLEGNTWKAIRAYLSRPGTSRSLGKFFINKIFLSMTISFGLLLLEIVLNAESTIFQHVIAFLLIVYDQLFHLNRVI